MNQPLESYQDEIYLTGVSGALPADLSSLEGLARARLAPQVFGYIAGGAGTGDTMRENEAAFRRWRIVPRMLTDVSSPAFASTVLGTRLAAPMLLAPVGVLRLAHPDGELAVARAAGSLGVPMILSTNSSVALEDVAQASGDGQRWFQLYWPKDREVAASLLSRAKAAGFSVLVLTLDARMLGWRPHDLDHAFLPVLRGLGVQNYLTDPAFVAGLAEPVADNEAAAILRSARMFGDPSLTWEDLPFVRERWGGPIVLKGIQSVADAQRAVAAGMDGIVVSNHGGRQVDGGIGALDALPPIVAAVGPRATVLFDSGVRGGADILKALALGARAVLIGRPYAYGLGLAGEDGVRHVLRALRNDFELTMRLAGCASLDDLSPATVTRSL
jgi:isopentenyl diphosphate isomerase/L-lactate dehydrogenase-like FMN-dependent dehydrogenase